MFTYRDFVGRKLKTPFKNRTTSGWEPALKFSTFSPKDESADLAVFNALYPKPLSNSRVKNSITSFTEGETVLTCFSLQYCNHLCIYVLYPFLVEFRHEAMIMSVALLESPLSVKDLRILCMLSLLACELVDAFDLMLAVVVGPLVLAE